MPKILQKPMWEQSLQTTLDAVNSTIGTIDAKKSAGKIEYEELRKNLEEVLQIILAICRDKWTSKVGVEEFIEFYKPFIKGKKNCDCVTVMKKDVHIQLLYETTKILKQIADMSKSFSYQNVGGAIAANTILLKQKQDIIFIKKMNCCYMKIEKGVKKNMGIFPAMDNKRHANWVERFNEVPSVAKSNQFVNGGHLSGVTSMAALGANSANIGGMLQAAAGGSFGLGLFGSVSLTLGCSSYSFSEGITANIGGSIAFNEGFSMCSPSFSARVTGGGGYSSNLYSSAKMALSGIGRSSELDASVSQPVEDYKAYKTCECIGGGEPMAGNLIPPNPNIDTHDTIVERALEQTKLVKEKFQELKCKIYCCCKKSKKKIKPRPENENVIKKSVLNFDKLAKRYTTQAGAFYNPCNKSKILINNTEWVNVPCGMNVIHNNIVERNECGDVTSTPSNQNNVIILQQENAEVNNKILCQMTLSLDKVSGCKEKFTEVVLINEILDIKELKEIEDSGFIIDERAYDDDVTQQFYYRNTFDIVQNIDNELRIMKW